jgi:sigma-B regulation protein RsbU (phosphoserine phosphatase)
MRLLIADDDAMVRRLLERTLERWGYEVLTVADGAEAWRVLEAADRPEAAILDWMMPGLTGIDVCRRVRERSPEAGTYLILLTSKDRMEDAVAALEAGADDHIAKPFAPEELRARVRVGERIVTLQQTLAQRVRALEDALQQVKRLQGLLPICAWCKKVRNDQNYWQGVDVYVAEHSDARFTHGICPDCRAKVSQTVARVPLT